MDLKWLVPCLCCHHELWLFQEAKHLNGVCGQRAASYLMAAWANCLPELSGEDGSPGSLRGSEWTSTMLDWVDPKGKAVLVLAMPLSILRSGTGQKRITDTQ